MNRRGCVYFFEVIELMADAQFAPLFYFPRRIRATPFEIEGGFVTP